MGNVLAGGRGIRASGPLLEVLGDAPLVDHHAHGILLSRPTLDEFRGLHSESGDPRQWPHVATGLAYRRGIRELAEFLGCEPTEEAVHQRRLESDPREYASALLSATGTDWLLVDDGFPPPGTGTSAGELGELAGCRTRPVLRIERVLEETGGAEPVARAREDGFVALKTIAAYRGGLHAVAPEVAAALEANETTGAPLPVQVHCGFGDADLSLPHADPGYLKPLIERFPETPFVLLHCYPFVREAGWLAHVYANVFFDLSLTFPFVARAADSLREALELGPVSKLLYASDASRTPELYYLAAKWWREALAEVLSEALPPDDAEEAGRAILRENALSLYELT